MPERLTFRPAEIISESSKLQANTHLPAMESVPSRNQDENSMKLQRWAVMMLMAFFAVFVLFILLWGG